MDDIEQRNAKSNETLERRQAAARATARAYARCFASGDGAAVLKDLQAKFSHRRPRFVLNAPEPALRAAMIDGQCLVLGEIEDAIAQGTTDSLSSDA